MSTATSPAPPPPSVTRQRTAIAVTATTTCSSLLREIQEIWDEIGESDTERDKILLQLEQECLDIYRRKVERTRKYKADLQKSLTKAEAEIADLIYALGERESFSQYVKVKGTLLQQISVISPVLEDLRLKKQERIEEFSETQLRIHHICLEIAGDNQFTDSFNPKVNEQDLTTKRLGELNAYLQELQSEKALRLQKVNSYISTVHDLSVVMSLDFNTIIARIHPSLVDPKNTESKSISNDTLARLTSEVQSLKVEKQQRFQKLRDLGNTIIELWNLMDTSVEEQKRFDHVTCINSSSIDDFSGDGCLALLVIKQIEEEVERLNVLKASKMKELMFKKQNELEEIYREVHLDVDSDKARQMLIGLMDSDGLNLSDLLSSMDDQILKAKEQALSRKDILDKVKKWKQASEEENWLDEYERDENRYSAGRGGHKNLKRAEKARILAGKIPSLVDNLTAKVKAWEMEKGIPFLYNTAPLLRTLEEDTLLRQQREEEKRRLREQKRLQEQLAVEQEALFGSRPTIKKPLGQSINSNIMVGTPRRTSTPVARMVISSGKERKNSGKAGHIIPVNYVALPKDD